jgi:hypothetical protein
VCRATGRKAPAGDSPGVPNTIPYFRDGLEFAGERNLETVSPRFTKPGTAVHDTIQATIRASEVESQSDTPPTKLIWFTRIDQEGGVNERLTCV